MPGMVELGEDIFLKPVRKGMPTYRGALHDMVANPRSATVMGLLEEARLARMRGQQGGAAGRLGEDAVRPRQGLVPRATSEDIDDDHDKLQLALRTASVSARERPADDRLTARRRRDTTSTSRTYLRKSATATATARIGAHMAIEMIEEFSMGTQIKVIGVGGGGGNAVEHMIDAGRAGRRVHLRQHRRAGAQPLGARTSLIQLGTTGLGAGAQARGGQAAAEEAVDRIRQAIDGAHMLFITAGMGGGTGTGAAPVIARVAKEMGILTVGVVTKPFDFEGSRRMKAADDGVAELEANVDSLIVILNDKLLDVLGDDVTQDQAFAHANDVLKNAVGGISDIIHMPGLVNVDFEDVQDGDERARQGDDGHGDRAAARTAPARPPSRRWPARCSKASTCRARAACWC